MPPRAATAPSQELSARPTAGISDWGCATSGETVTTPSRAMNSRAVSLVPLVSQQSPPLALPPFIFADQTGHPELFLSGWDDPALQSEACNFENKLSPDCFLEFFTIFDRHDEGARPSDHAVLVVEIEILDIGRRIRWLLHHNRKAVDD